MNTRLFKEQLLNELYAPYQHCTRCPLGYLGRTQVVFGQGNADANIIFVGEGPGKEEDLQGKPFVGRSGMLLTKTLLSLGIERDSVFITNIVKCRPPNNRTPTNIEATTCKDLLLVKQIKIIKPRVICTLGSSPLQSLINQKIKITQTRGEVIPYNKEIIIIPTYHPAYILRSSSKLPLFIADIKLAIEKAANKK